MKVYDLNSDGCADIVLLQPDAARIYYCSGDMEFQEGTALPEGLSDGRLLIADYDGDGNNSIIICGTDVEGTAVLKAYSIETGTQEPLYNTVLLNIDVPSNPVVTISGLSETGEVCIAVSGLDDNGYSITDFYNKNWEKTDTVQLDAVIQAEVADYNQDGFQDMFCFDSEVKSSLITL